MAAPATKTQTSAEKERIKSLGKKYAEKTVNETYADSTIKDNSADFPKFSKDELKLGKVLGKGGFGTVYEVRGFESGKAVPTKKLVSSRNVIAGLHDEEVERGELESRKFIADHCLRNNNDARYAVKFLSPNVVGDPPNFIQGIIDMAIETRVLSDTEHPNIVKLRALPQISPYNEDYFIVMDRLYDTLEGRIDKWEKKFKKCTGMGGRVFDRKGEKKKDLLEEKMVVAFDLSDALGYLHSRKILYRDIKVSDSPCDTPCLQLPLDEHDETNGMMMKLSWSPGEHCRQLLFY
jgi:serine/threonine protein kinase